MRVLCVAEKPSISKSITQILSGGQFDNRPGIHKYIRNYDFSYRFPPPLGGPGDADFTVTAVLGHLTGSDFPDDLRKWGSCDPFTLFDAPIITSVSQDLKQVATNLKNEARRADMLMIWTDCDREGEHIGSEVAAVCRSVNRNIIVKRARFSAIIAAQIHNACKQANDLDMRQANAVEARINLDLRIGAAFTRLTSLGLQARLPELAQQVISYGPCQFPTLGFVVDQWNRVQAFVPETFWYIYVAIEKEDEDDPTKVETVEFKWRRNHLFDMETAVVLYEQCVERPTATVIKVDNKPANKWKPLPLTTVELQQSGSRLLHMAPKKILDIAEKLYQKGFLSYPRTETDRYDKDFDFQSLIQKQTYDGTWGAFAQRLVDGEFERPRNGKKDDKAHPPIHPTAHAGNLEADERRVFELITRRFLASCHSNAKGNTTTVEVEIANEIFSTTGLIVTQRNYLEVYPYDKWATNAVPNFQVGEQFMPSVCELKEGTTTRPSLLTEADLVGLMDKNGIGTDATIAEHISKIVERQYVHEKQEQRTKYLVPSPLGIGLVEGYNKIGLDRSLSKPHLRAETEHRMQLICDGVKQKAEVLDVTLDEYRDVFVTARREFNTVIQSVMDYMHGEGDAQDALRAATRGGRGGRGAAARGRGGRGGRGGGGGAPPPARNNRQDDDDDNDDDSDGGDGFEGGAGAVRRGGATTARASTRGRGASTSTRGGRASGAEAKAPAKRKKPDDDDEGDGPKCNCDTAAVKRTVNKADSGNFGKQFWTCPKPMDEQCGYFEWAEGEGANAAGPSRTKSAPPAKKSRAAPAHQGDGDVKRCDCRLEAKCITVVKEGPNKGRQFWTCPNSAKAQCKYFEWVEEGLGPQTDSYTREARGPRTNTADSGGGSSGGCYKCNEQGHWANACPNDRAGSKSKSKPSGRSGSGFGGPDTSNDGEYAREGKGREGKGKLNSRGECYKCGKTGHWASNCPNEGSSSRSSRGSSRGRGRGGSSSRRGGSSGGTSGECFKCGKPGHWSNACPNDGGRGGRGRWG